MMISKEVPIETSRGPAVGVISQLNGVQAMRLFMRLANRLGPALPAMKAGGSATLLAGVLERIDADEYERIQNETLSKLVVRWPDSGEVDSNAARTEASCPAAAERTAGTSIRAIYAGFVFSAPWPRLAMPANSRISIPSPLTRQAASTIVCPGLCG